MSMTQLDYIVATIWGLSAMLFCYLFMFNHAEEVAMGGGAPSATQRRTFNHWFLKIFGPFIISSGQIIATLPLSGRDQLRKRLIQAGSPGGLSVDEFHAARLVAMGLLALAGIYIDIELGSSPFILILFLGLGLVYPNIWLNGLIQKRQRRIFRDLPDTLDLLRLAVDAGMDLSSAMSVVVEKGRRGPLLDEFEKIDREMSLGRTRKEALKNFAERLQMAEINSFVLALVQADQLGASIGPILRVQAEMARTRRWQLAEALVNKMPMKMLGPLVLFIFPASFIILFTPLIIQYMQSGD